MCIIKISIVYEWTFTESTVKGKMLDHFHQEQWKGTVFPSPRFALNTGGGDGWTITGYLMCARNGPSSYILNFIQSPSHPGTHVQSHFHSRDEESKDQRCVQNHRGSKSQGLSFNLSFGPHTRCSTPKLSLENTNGLWGFYLFPSPAQIKHWFPDSSFMKGERRKEEIIPCFDIDPCPQSVSALEMSKPVPFSFQSQRKAMPKNVLTTAQLHPSHILAT